MLNFFHLCFATTYDGEIKLYIIFGTLSFRAAGRAVADEGLGGGRRWEQARVTDRRTGRAQCTVVTGRDYGAFDFDARPRQAPATQTHRQTVSRIASFTQRARPPSREFRAFAPPPRGIYAPSSSFLTRNAHSQADYSVLCTAV